MRLLLVHQYFMEETDSGGSRFNEMTKVWAEEGHEVTVLAGMLHGFEAEKLPEYKGKLFVRKLHDKVTVWRCFVPESYNKNFRKRLFNYLSFVLSSTWAGVFKTKLKFDLILVTSPPLFLGITAYILSWLKKIPFVFEVRDLWPESAIDTGILRNKLLIHFAYRFEKFIYKKARLINVLTPAFRERLIQWKKVPQDKIIYIPNASDFRLSDKYLHNFNPSEFRREKGFDDRFVIIYVGAHGIANNLMQLLDVAILLKDTNLLFILIGDGMQKPMLSKEIEKKELKNIWLFDPLTKNEVFKYIVAADMGISILKKAEIFKTIYSNKTFDYMACKKPVLMLIDGLSRDLIEKANCGIYAEPEYPENIASIIRFCMKNPSLLREMGENGYKYAKKHFDRYNLAIQYLSYLSNVI